MSDPKTESMNERAQKLREKMDQIDLGEPSFEKFMTGMIQQALYHLGAMPDPITGKTEGNLKAAKYTIDLIDILRQKTEGNRSEQESELISKALYDLRIAYVQSSKN